MGEEVFVYASELANSFCRVGEMVDDTLGNHLTQNKAKSVFLDQRS
jgi:hypothetical protein